MPYRVAIIGYGLSAKIFHLPFVLSNPSFKLQAISQRNPTDSNDASKDYPDATVYKKPEEVITDPNVDLVILCTPPTAHFSQAKLALESAKHVLVEKPFAPTMAECDELIAIAKKANKLLTVYQNRRWDNDFQTLSQLIKSNTLGRIVDFESHFDRWDPSAAVNKPSGPQYPGSGAVFDLGTHLIDQILFTFGLPQGITGFIGSQLSPASPAESEDACTVLLHYADGLTATVKASVVSPEVDQLRFWVRGERGSYQKCHLDIQESQLLDGVKVSDANYAVEPEERWGTLNTVDGNKITSRIHPNVKPATYGGYYSALAKALDGKGDVPVKAEDARDVIRIVEMAKESSRLRKTLDVE
ncbi:NAD binding Rossmann fold oxidoreductase [Aulographum hederae CBS 113979]|uniref:NAD binding Rossmann fold oxidoreductase n=1 Tax=Aulographum hederae CBS 113979 TaxID=1176131 RepID=A0A6G1GW36_9PEZI|nr:NAD binding Rossmann fold oxidoreductase [Aulographum hederae CBS 113979]